MNIKKSIILISVIIIVLIIILSILLILIPKKRQENIGNIENIENGETIIEYNKIEDVKNIDTFFAVSSCVDRYLIYLYSQDKESLSNIISNEYITKNNITKDNILNKLGKLEDIQIFTAREMKEINNNENISTYYVYGTIKDEAYEEDREPEEHDFYIAIILDKINRTYAVIPNEKAPNEIKNIEYLKIESNDTNTYYSSHLTDTQIANVYLNDYRNITLKNVNKAYELLDKEYKEKRYPTLELYKKYVESISDEIYSPVLESSLRNEYEDYTEYICKDQYGNIYIFKETAVMQYTVILDNYTINNKAFNETYENANIKDKGLINVDRFFKMINMQDFETAYKVLDDSFKQNYFKTQSDFEQYMKAKTFRYNKVSYKEYSDKITNLYSYKVELTDATNRQEGKTEFNIFVKLGENSDFTMSFEIN